MEINVASKNSIISKIPSELQGLGEIALNLWWTFNPRAKNLFRSVNPFLWKQSNENPIKMFKYLDGDDFKKLIKNRKFMIEYKYVYALFKSI